MLYYTCKKQEEITKPNASKEKEKGKDKEMERYEAQIMIAQSREQKAKARLEIIEELARFARTYEDENGEPVDLWNGEGYGDMVHEVVDDIMHYLLTK